MHKPMNRRAVTAAIGAAAVAVPVAALAGAGGAGGARAADKGPELHGLIEKHRATYKVFVTEISRDEDWRPEVEAADEAEKDAFWALCEHRCESMEEAREKSRYLLTTALVNDMWDDEAKATLASFVAS